MTNYLLLAVCLILISCGSRKKIEIKDMGSFSLPVGADLGIAGHSIDPLERCADFYFNKRYKIVNDKSIELVSSSRDSSKSEPQRNMYTAFYDSLFIPRDSYIDIAHSDFVMDKTILIGERKVDGLKIYLYKNEEDWGIYLMVKKENATDAILVGKVGDGYTSADFVVHDITGDEMPEVIVISHCIKGINETENISVYKII